MEKEIQLNQNGKVDVYRAIYWERKTQLFTEIDKEDVGFGYHICAETGLCFRDDYLVKIEDLGCYVNLNTAYDSDKYNRCADCGKWFSTAVHMEMDRFGVCVCDRCISSWNRCTRCGALVHEDDTHYNRSDDPFCDDCWYDSHDSEYSFANVYDYGYKPEPIFHTADVNNGKSHVLYMGVELETDHGRHIDDYSDDLYSISDEESLFYQKEDCSISDGIEIVTHPCDLETHMNSFPWEDIIATARRYEFLSHDAETCGFHVHVNRDYLGDTNDQRDLTVAKIILLVDREWDKVYRFSRRTSSTIHWAEKPNAFIDETDNTETVIKKSKDISDHRNAVNQLNVHTLEFRVFRGTLKLNTIKATLQFVSNLVNFAKDTPLAKIQTSTWDDIINYHQYPELNTYLVERGLMEAPVAAVA